jgi:hypothetical protein
MMNEEQYREDLKYLVDAGPPLVYDVVKVAFECFGTGDPEKAGKWLHYAGVIMDYTEAARDELDDDDDDGDEDDEPDGDDPGDNPDRARLSMFAALSRN